MGSTPGEDVGKAMVKQRLGYPPRGMVKPETCLRNHCIIGDLGSHIVNIRTINTATHQKNVIVLKNLITLMPTLH